MSPIKKEVIELVKSLPDSCTLEDVHYHLYVREKIERGMKAIREGHILSQEEAEKKVKKWLKSSGRCRH